MSQSDVTVVRQLRRRATDLRRIAQQLNDQADALEQQLSDVPLIGGRMLADAVAAILAQAAGSEDPGWRGLHYTELASIIERGGLRIRGVNPAATLLASVDRDPRIVCVQSRSGRYRLRGDK